MAVFTVSVKQIKNNASERIKWCLDTPNNGDEHEGKNLQSEGLRVKGWVLKTRNIDATLVLLDGADIVPLGLNTTRVDVIKKLASGSSNLDNDITCGFDHVVFPKTADLSIGFIHAATFVPLYELSIEGVFKILEGKNNWLFLDNDTNNSVEQFAGKTKFSRKEKKNWLEYASAFSSLPLSRNGKSVFLIAPSKEYVVEESYPYKKSKRTPLDQLRKMVDEKFKLIIPINALRNHEKRTFRVCDTHWSCHGAELATLEALKILNINCAPIRKLFYKDQYVERVVAGDLGSKIYPPQKHSEEFLTNFSYRRLVVYDNNLPNFGRTFIIENTNAIHDKTLLVYGSSSAYSMFNYLARIFKTVVFFHTAGNIDRDLTEKIAPDYLLAQSNARFVVKAPSFDIKISDYITEKQQRLDVIPEKKIKRKRMSEFAARIVTLLGD